jgi:Uma2 family endonuclease
MASPIGDLSQQDLRPLRRSEYMELADAGHFDDERVELLYGVVVRMSPPKPDHDGAIQALTHLLVTKLYPRAAVRIQSSLAASDVSQPEPDVAVVPPGAYRDEHPTQAWLVIEVSGTSLRKDEGIKASLYAETGVPEYWVVDLAGAVVRVHSDVVEGRYTRMATYARGDRITLNRFADVTIEVNDVVG